MIIRGAMLDFFEYYPALGLLEVGFIVTTDDALTTPYWPTSSFEALTNSSVNR